MGRLNLSKEPPLKLNVLDPDDSYFSEDDEKDELAKHMKN